MGVLSLLQKKRGRVSPLPCGPHGRDCPNVTTRTRLLGGTWVAQLVKHLTLDFSSDHDLTVHEFEPHVGLLTDSMEPAWDSLSPALSACLSQNK